MIVEEEAEVVREVFARYLEGDTPPQITRDLNERRVPTSQGCRWRPESVRALISSRHVSGIRVFCGEDFGEGDRPVIIDRGTWREAQDRRAYRASAYLQCSFRFYVLRGLVMCKKCGSRWPDPLPITPPTTCAPAATTVMTPRASAGSTPLSWKPSSPTPPWSCSPGWM